MAISKRLRFEVFRRDGYACVYCGRRAPSVTLEADHKVPRCMGGPDTLDNLVAACWDCNRGKGPLDFRGREPERWEGGGHNSWEEFMLEQTEDHLVGEEAPKCFRTREPRQHINFKRFDVYAAAAQIPKAEHITIMTADAIFRKADFF